MTGEAKVVVMHDVSSVSEVDSYGFSCRNASTPELFDGSVRVDFPELTT